MEHLKAACAYIAIPQAGCRDAVVEEVKALILSSVNFKAKMLLVATTGRLDLIHLVEKTHGDAAWDHMSYRDDRALRTIKDTSIPVDALRHIYGRMIAMGDKSNPGETHKFFKHIGYINCPIYFEVLMGFVKPTPYDITRMLLDSRVTEGSTFTDHTDIIAILLEDLDLTPSAAMALTGDLISRSLYRSLAILAKLGIAQNADYAMMNGVKTEPMTLLCSHLRSNHGRAYLMTSLPPLRNLIGMSGAGVTKSVVSSLSVDEPDN
jgi:hypothetical protein